MIPVLYQPFPDGEQVFNSLVNRLENEAHHKRTGRLKASWGGKCLDTLFAAYKHYCAYSAVKMTRKQASVDHYLPKSKNPQLAYDWTNYRLAKQSVNEAKGASVLLDPFTIENDWLTLDFNTFRIQTSSNLPPNLAEQAVATCLVLNKNPLIDLRRNHWLTYQTNQAHYPEAFTDLQAISPFVAYEATRQGLLAAG
jgi:hypothetical protein